MQIETGKLDEDFRPNGAGKSLSVALWTAQAFLAALFLFAGVMKFVMPVEEMTKQSSLPGPFFHFIGVAELFGAVGLIVPALFRVWPWLTPVAACGLVIIMAGATIISIPMGGVALFPRAATVRAPQSSAINCKAYEIEMKLALDCPGRACKYWLVVATEAWPSVC